jgi:hypothetical protein
VTQLRQGEWPHPSSVRIPLGAAQQSSFLNLAEVESESGEVEPEEEAIVVDLDLREGKY